MKKKFIILGIIIAGLLATFLLFKDDVSKVYNYLVYNYPLVYGKSMTIYEVLNDGKIKIDDENLRKYKFRKALVKDKGSTHHQEIIIDDNKIIFLGNRNLVEINNQLYVYEE